MLRATGRWILVLTQAPRRKDGTFRPVPHHAAPCSLTQAGRAQFPLIHPKWLDFLRGGEAMISEFISLGEELSGYRTHRSAL